MRPRFPFACCLKLSLVTAACIVSAQPGRNPTLGSELPGGLLANAIIDARQNSPLVRAAQNLRVAQVNPIPAFLSDSTPVLGTLPPSRSSSVLPLQSTTSRSPSASASAVLYNRPNNPSGFSLNQGVQLSGAGVTLSGNGGGSGIRVGTDGITYRAGESQIDVEQLAAAASILNTLAQATGVENIHVGLDGLSVNRGTPSEVKVGLQDRGLVLTAPRADNTTERASVELALLRTDPAAAPSVSLTVTSDPLGTAPTAPSAGLAGSLTIPLSGETATRLATAIQSLVGGVNGEVSGEVTANQASGPAPEAVPDQASATSPALLDLRASLNTEITRLLDEELARRASSPTSGSSSPSGGPTGTLGEPTSTQQGPSIAPAVAPAAGHKEHRNKTRSRAPSPKASAGHRKLLVEASDPEPATVMVRGTQPPLASPLAVPLISWPAALGQMQQEGLFGGSGSSPSRMATTDAPVRQVQGASGRSSTPSMVRMGGHSVFGADIGALGYTGHNSGSAAMGAVASSDHMGADASSSSHMAATGDHVGLGGYMGHTLFDITGMNTDPALLAQDNPPQYPRRPVPSSGTQAVAVPSVLPPTGAIGGHTEPAASQAGAGGEELDALAHMMESSGSHPMASMGDMAGGGGMSMGFTEGHVPMDGLPISMLQQMTAEHLSLP